MSAPTAVVFDLFGVIACAQSPTGRAEILAAAGAPAGRAEELWRAGSRVLSRLPSQT